MTNYPPEQVIEFSIHQPMISASHDAESRLYHMAEGHTGRRWVYAAQENAGDNIYADGGPGSDGMGGRTLTFDLVDGKRIQFVGPWKTTAENLFIDTGVDVRNTSYTKGIVAFSRRNGAFDQGDFYSQVIYYDDEPVLGSYRRIQDIAQAAADETKRQVYYAFISHGGGTSSWCFPKKKDDN